MDNQSFFSNGKLLLTGEYLILKGALALAVPVIPGQKLTIEEKDTDSPGILWRSKIEKEAWFEARFSLPDLDIICSNNKDIAVRLARILKAAKHINPDFPARAKQYNILSNIEFNINWGLGSSSSLISNIAWWAGIDPYDLHFAVSEGSGYDIACARADGPLLYQLSDDGPITTGTDFNPSFKKHIYFVYSGKKQDSSSSVADFLKRENEGENEIRRISEISREFVMTNNLDTFNALIREHEQIISGFIGQETVKSQKFPGFTGEIKSLGAWGGDFLMVTWQGKEQELRQYFNSKGIDVIFGFDELIRQ